MTRTAGSTGWWTVLYGLSPQGEFCPVFLLAEMTSTGCGRFPSAAKSPVAIEDGRRVWTLTLPKKEMSGKRPSAAIVLEIHEQGRRLYHPGDFQKPLLFEYGIR